MHTGYLPTASRHGTWVENIEVLSAEDDTPLDLSSLTEITLYLRDQRSQYDDLTLTMTAGDITIPDDGIIQWRAEASAMGVLEPRLYEVLLILEDATDTLPLLLGTVSIVE